MGTSRINNKKKEYNVEIDPRTTLLWVQHDHLDLIGTEYGCGVASCGACTVLFDGHAVRSCSMPISVEIGIDPAGLGEPPFPRIFAGVATALYQATGKRFYHQPYINELNNG